MIWFESAHRSLRIPHGGRKIPPPDGARVGTARISIAAIKPINLFMRNSSMARLLRQSSCNGWFYRTLEPFRKNPDRSSNLGLHQPNTIEAAASKLI
jgi:hypothetical protein